MRKRFSIALFGAVAVVAAMAASALAVVGPASDGNTQDATIGFKPAKLGKKTPTPVTLAVTTKTGTVTEPLGKPVPVTQAILDFDKGASVFAKGYPTCPIADLENVPTEIALENCKKAKIGGGAATVLLPSSRGVTVENTTVTAFNGTPQGGNPVVLLHVYGSAPIQTTQVLTGVVTKYGKEGYGPRLTVDVPLIAGGAGALTDFQVTVFKKFRYKGKQRSYVSSTCSKKRKLKGRAQFIYRDGQSLTVEGTQKCSQKPEPKKKKKKGKR
jgi:hypothetical protein